MNMYDLKSNVCHSSLYYYLGTSQNHKYVGVILLLVSDAHVIQLVTLKLLEWFGHRFDYGGDQLSSGCKSGEKKGRQLLGLSPSDVVKTLPYRSVLRYIFSEGAGSGTRASSVFAFFLLVTAQPARHAKRE
jgi:hypothetical protein